MEWCSRLPSLVYLQHRCFGPCSSIVLVVTVYSAAYCICLYSTPDVLIFNRIVLCILRLTVQQPGNQARRILLYTHVYGCPELIKLPSLAKVLEGFSQP